MGLATVWVVTSVCYSTVWLVPSEQSGLKYRLGCTQSAIQFCLGCAQSGLQYHHLGYSGVVALTVVTVMMTTYLYIISKAFWVCLG